MDGRYELYRQGSGGWTSMRNEEFQEEDVWSGGWTSMRNEEFQEEDVWALHREINDFSNFTTKIDTSEDSSVLTPRHISSTAAKMIPITNTTNPNQESIFVHQSAPVNIPDWSMIYKKKCPNNASKNASWVDDDDDGFDGNLMPPHEWIAKKLAMSQISNFSVCEGAGRTLKGRDLSRVRNAVLTKTGLLE